MTASPRQRRRGPLDRHASRCRFEARPLARTGEYGRRRGLSHASLESKMTKATAASANAPVRYSPARASSVAVEAVSLRNEATARPPAVAANSATTIHHMRPCYRRAAAVKQEQAPGRKRPRSWVGRTPSVSASERFALASARRSDSAASSGARRLVVVHSRLPVDTPETAPFRTLREWPAQLVGLGASGQLTADLRPRRPCPRGGRCALVLVSCSFGAGAGRCPASRHDTPSRLLDSVRCLRESRLL
jgi:hypothetical protein